MQSSNSLAVRVGVRVRVRVRVRVTRGLGLVGLGLGLGLESPAGPLLRSDELVADAPRVLVVRAGELAVGIRRLARGAATIEPAVKVVVQQLVRVRGWVRVGAWVRVSGSLVGLH